MEKTTSLKHKIDNKGQALLFSNPLLEKLTKTSLLFIWLLYLPILIAMSAFVLESGRLSFLTFFLTFISGMASWTLTEYVIHRFLFHGHEDSGKMNKMRYLIHGTHHAFPRDKERLIMPPVPSLIITSTFFVLFYLIMGNYAWAFFPGFIFGYLLYGSLHYAIHAYAPPFRWMKPMWRNHQLHHYSNVDKGFGVSTTLWDRLFGTMFDVKNEKEDKEKEKTLRF
jgi:sterol desaturase/sphingolipid hydroxylase (fatty acid hydroxylase superfamily)